MCASWYVCLCVFWGLTRERKGVRKRNRTFSFVLFCVLLYYSVEEHNTKSRTQIICPPFPPSVSSFTPLVHSLTYRTMLNWQKWPQVWREPHRQMGHSVEMFSQQRKRKSARKKDGVRTTWVSPLLCLPPSSLSSSLAEGHHSAQTSDKDFQCAFWRKKSVSQQQLDCLAVATLCVRPCACVQEVGVQTTHCQKWWDSGLKACVNTCSIEY